VSLGRLAEEVFEAVIFDLDGTLIDSTPAMNRAGTRGLVNIGLAPTKVVGITASRRVRGPATCDA
jgi:beta-phosphoglucomutase-like phosphatase (HAD superfamily)